MSTKLAPDQIHKEHREYQQCQRCVMDTSDGEILFDDLGHCNHCTEYLRKISQLVYQGAASDRELELLAQRVRTSGQGKDFDCVVGVSGGVDSSYTLHLAKRIGLRPLAVHLDNGWDAEEAVRNIKSICGNLGVEYESYILNWEEFKDIQLAFLKASIVEMEIPTDVAIQVALHKTAAAHGIKFILSGGNLATEGIMPKSWFYYPKDSRLFRSVIRQFGTRRIKEFSTFDYPQELYYKFIKGVRILYPLNFVPFSKDSAVKLLKEELGWREYGGKHHESKFTKMVLGYIHPVKFGIDYRKATLSTQICAGTVTREDAIEELARLPYDEFKIEAEKDYVAKKLGIGSHAFQVLLDQPAKSYRDYPNNEKFLTNLYGAYRKIFTNNRSIASAVYEPDV